SRADRRLDGRPRVVRVRGVTSWAAVLLTPSAPRPSWEVVHRPRTFGARAEREDVREDHMHDARNRPRTPSLSTHLRGVFTWFTWFDEVPVWPQARGRLSPSCLPEPALAAS